MEFFAWLEASSVGIWVRESLWCYPLAITCHAIGMGIVVGLVTMMNIRVLGFASGLPFSTFEKLSGIAWSGVALNLVSGLFLLIGDAVRFITQGSFQIKMLLIALGVVSVWSLLRSIREDAGSLQAKIIAVISLVFWFGAIIAGRATAYI